MFSDSHQQNNNNGFEQGREQRNANGGAPIVLYNQVSENESSPLAQRYANHAGTQGGANQYINSNGAAQVHPAGGPGTQFGGPYSRTMDHPNRHGDLSQHHDRTFGGSRDDEFGVPGGGSHRGGGGPNAAENEEEMQENNLQRLLINIKKKADAKQDIMVSLAQPCGLFQKCPHAVVSNMCLYRF